MFVRLLLLRYSFPAAFDDSTVVDDLMLYYSLVFASVTLYSLLICEPMLAALLI